MFQVISSPTVDFSHLSSRCRKCAVVGNSGNLRRSKRGVLIDSHNFVIRYVCSHTRAHTHIYLIPTLHFIIPLSGWTKRWLEDMRKMLGTGQRITSCTRRVRWTLNVESASSCCRSNLKTCSGLPAHCPPDTSKCMKCKWHTQTQGTYTNILKI